MQPSVDKPPACPECEPYGGNWRMAKGGLKRCTCARGEWLMAADRRKLEPAAVSEPKISATAADQIAAALSAIGPGYPREPAARAIIAAEIVKLCHSNQQAEWLLSRMLTLYTRWPGFSELRRVFCQTYLPLDGLLSHSLSEFYPDGVPSEFPTAPTPMVALPPGRTVSADEELDQAVREVAERKKLGPDLQERLARRKLQ